MCEALDKLCNVWKRRAKMLSTPCVTDIQCIYKVLDCRSGHIVTRFEVPLDEARNKWC